MQSIALGTAAVAEIISAYSATNQQLAAVAVPPAWVVIGAFFMPADATVKLEAIGEVTLAGLTIAARLFDVAAALPVSGSTTDLLTTTTTARKISGAFLLPGQKVYQIQAQVIGDPTQTGIVRAAGLVGG